MRFPVGLTGLEAPTQNITSYYIILYYNIIYYSTALAAPRRSRDWSFRAGRARPDRPGRPIGSDPRGKQVCGPGWPYVIQYNII